MVVCEASAAGKIVSAVAAALRSANVTEAEVAAAKKNLLADVYAIQGTAASLVEDIGTQVNSLIKLRPTISNSVFMKINCTGSVIFQVTGDNEKALPLYKVPLNHGYWWLVVFRILYLVRTVDPDQG